MNRRQALLSGLAAIPAMPILLTKPKKEEIYFNGHLLGIVEESLSWQKTKHTEKTRQGIICIDRPFSIVRKRPQLPTDIPVVDYDKLLFDLVVKGRFFFDEYFYDRQVGYLAPCFQ